MRDRLRVFKPGCFFNAVSAYQKKGKKKIFWGSSDWLVLYVVSAYQQQKDEISLEDQYVHTSRKKGYLEGLQTGFLHAVCAYQQQKDEGSIEGLQPWVFF
jgi:hypothetical protein